MLLSVFLSVFAVGVYDCAGSYGYCLDDCQDRYDECTLNASYLYVQCIEETGDNQACQEDLDEFLCVCLTDSVNCEILCDCTYQECIGNPPCPPVTNPPDYSDCFD